MIAVANQNQRVAFARELYRLHVDLGHQRAGRVNHPQLAQLARLTHFGRDAMGAVDDPLAGRDLLDAVHENGALGAQLVHHITVMDDLFAHVNGRSEGLQRNANDVNGAHHTGAEAPAASTKARSWHYSKSFFVLSSIRVQTRFSPQLLYCNSAGISNVTVGEWLDSAACSENLTANGATLNVATPMRTLGGSAHLPWTAPQFATWREKFYPECPHQGPQTFLGCYRQPVNITQSRRVLPSSPDDG